MTEIDEPVTTTNGNPFGPIVAVEHTASVEAHIQRAIAETQAALVIAQRCPRDERVSFDRVIAAFQRPSLAEHALYAYARGGTEITGPSIRAAEAIAAAWGNIEYGHRELEQKGGRSTVEAFAWDKQTNVRTSTEFVVPHERHTRSGVTRLTDPRDVYEHIANQASRRVRARILAIIPADVVDAAVKETEKTLRAKVDITPERIKSLIEKFGAFGVSTEAIEKRIQRRVDTITPSQMLALAKIYNSLNDSMSAPADWFEMGPAAVPEGSTTARVSKKLAEVIATPAAPPAAPEPPVEPPYAFPEVDGMAADEYKDYARSYAAERGLDEKALRAFAKEHTGSDMLVKKYGVALLQALAAVPLATA